MKVGDYVRTKKRGFQPPQIARIKSIKKDIGYHNQYYIELDHNLIPDYEFYIYEEDIEKSSHDKIDLIKVGDYVNGVLVESIYQREKDKLYIHSFDTEIMMCFTNNNIKSIVTKEQFESMEYKVGE